MTGPAAEKKTYSLTKAEPLAIVVHCSDPRFQRAFQEFIHSELGMKEGTFIPLVVSGGVGSLSEPLKLPKEFKFMKERIETFLERFDSIRRIVLINHEDCRHYETMKTYLGNLFLNRVNTLIERQKVDLKGVANTFLGLFDTKIHIELYYAHFADAGKSSVVFEKIIA